MSCPKASQRRCERGILLGLMPLLAREWHLLYAAVVWRGSSDNLHDDDRFEDVRGHEESIESSRCPKLLNCFCEDPESLSGSREEVDNSVGDVIWVMLQSAP
jgi:hypothetical protein